MNCIQCHGPLPESARRDARYCSGRCRMARLRAKQSSATVPGPFLCPSCDRRIGTVRDDRLVLKGRWRLRADTWRWSSWADERRLVVDPGTQIACQHCRHEVTP